MHRAALPEAVAARFGLGVDRRVPPAIEVEDVRRLLQIEPLATGAQREDQRLAVRVGAETLQHALARALVEVAGVGDGARPEAGGDGAGAVGRVGELGEDERLVPLGRQRSQPLGEVGEFARLAAGRADVADLAQPGDQLEDVLDLDPLAEGAQLDDPLPLGPVVALALTAAPAGG